MQNMSTDTDREGAADNQRTGRVQAYLRTRRRQMGWQNFREDRDAIIDRAAADLDDH